MKQSIGSCLPEQHLASRRQWLFGMLGAGTIGCVASAGLLPAFAADLTRRGKRLLVVSQGGGLSQLESWDLKLDTDHGGPCLPISTSVPGLQIGEWLPHTARQMHHLLVVRSMSTGENNHGPADYLMTSGRREGAALVYPHMAAVANHFLTSPEHPVPGFVTIGRSGNPTFLGPQFGPIAVDVSKPVANLNTPGHLAMGAEERRKALRSSLDKSFAKKRGSADVQAYAATFEQAEKIVRNKRLFSLENADPQQMDRYGRHEFGQRCLMALRLLEQGVTCVTVEHSGYDTHAENFNVHYDLLAQFDRPFAALVEDLAATGLLEDTVLVNMGEFGRTPSINLRMGRDHWSNSWSLVLGGAAFPRGAVYGSTSANGAEVVDGPVNAPQLFHTIMKSLGVDSHQSWTVDGERVPIGDPAFGPVDALFG